MRLLSVRNLRNRECNGPSARSRGAFAVRATPEEPCAPSAGSIARATSPSRSASRRTATRATSAPRWSRASRSFTRCARPCACRPTSCWALPSRACERVFEPASQALPRRRPDEIPRRDGWRQGRGPRRLAGVASGGRGGGHPPRAQRGKSKAAGDPAGDAARDRRAVSQPAGGAVRHGGASSSTTRPEDASTAQHKARLAELIRAFTDSVSETRPARRRSR